MLALVTGASSGIGKALCHLLRSKGYTVVGAARQVDQVEGESLVYSLDNLKIFIEKRRPDLVIHAAGFGLYGEAITHSDEEAIDMFTVHTLPTLTLARAMAKAQNRGDGEKVLLTISSVAGEFPAAGMALYSATKAAVTNLSRSLDFELSQKGIRVLVNCPGMVKTPFASKAAKKTFTHPSWVMSCEKAARLIYKQIEKRKGKTIIDWRYKLLPLILLLFPCKVLQRNTFHNIVSR